MDTLFTAETALLETTERRAVYVSLEILYTAATAY